MNEEIHIGGEIHCKLNSIGMSKAEFARRMNVTPNAVQWWLKKESIDTNLLAKISSVLKFNFFTLYGDEIIEAYDEELVLALLKRGLIGKEV